MLNALVVVVLFLLYQFVSLVKLVPNLGLEIRP